MEDFVTWTDTSKIKRHVLDYNNEVWRVLQLCSLKLGILIV